jgi:hypothetical protein
LVHPSLSARLADPLRDVSGFSEAHLALTDALNDAGEDEVGIVPEAESFFYPKYGQQAENTGGERHLKDISRGRFNRRS